MAVVYLSLGSNLGDRAANLRTALARLTESRVSIVQTSSLFETEPVGETPEPVPDYLNCAARGETSLNPDDVLQVTKSVEQSMGRAPTFRWGPRVIDIDILLYDSVSLDRPNLTIPHTEMRRRAFVLIPLAEIAPDLQLPDGTSVADLLMHPAIQIQRVRPYREGRED